MRVSPFQLTYTESFPPEEEAVAVGEDQHHSAVRFIRQRVKAQIRRIPEPRRVAVIDIVAQVTHELIAIARYSGASSKTMTKRRSPACRE